MARIKKEEKERARKILVEELERMKATGYHFHQEENWQMTCLASCLSGYLPNIGFAEGWKMVTEVIEQGRAKG